MKTINIGIDTSCYTTSLVAIDEKNTILYSGRILLTVKKGTVGLRQSDAFFQHVQNLPQLYHECCSIIEVNKVKALIVSDQPRNIVGSYMPVFTAGLQFARVISDSLKIPLHRKSHQENHLYASAFNHKLPTQFIGVHISGGTSEILKVNYDHEFDIEIIGQTLDLSFGKLIDRLGVYMGFDFPCGKEMDSLVDNDSDVYQLKDSLKNLSFNISGIENKLKTLFDQDKNVKKISRSLFKYIGHVLIKVLDKAMLQYDIPTIVISGGVSANSIIRKILEDYFNDQIIFTDIAYATDHAIGNAYYGNVVTHET